MSKAIDNNYHGVEIKNCPFCGAQAKLVVRNRTMVNHKRKYNTYVFCPRCDARGMRVLEDDFAREARMLAVERWNDRI